MYVIVTTGGKQYRAHIGHTFIVNDTLLTQFTIVPCFIISTENNIDIIKQYYALLTRVTLLRGKKQIGIKFKRRKNYIRRFGFRQPTTALRIAAIFSHEVFN
jgi:ribosomal protein L21